MAKTIGALWLRDFEKDGKKEKMMSGELDLGALGSISIAVFKNKKKDKDNQPDYRIVLSNPADKPKENGKSSGSDNAKEEDIDF